MIEAAITSSVLILAVILVRFIFKEKISRKFQYALWGLVLIRLILPFPLFESNISVMNALPAPSIANQQIYVVPISKTTLGEGNSITVGKNNKIEDANSFGYSVLSNNGETVTRYAAKTTIAEILKIGWIIGGIAVGLWFVVINIVFYVRLRKSRVPYPCESNLPLKIFIADELSSPCLFGLFHPAIYLTPNASMEEAFPYVLAHEYCHYRHVDHIWSLLRGVCLAMYWWNPLIWVAAILSRRDSELACDEAVITKVGEENRLAYGKTLVDMIAVRHASNIMCAATTMTGGKHEIKERLNLIVRNPKSVVTALIAAVLIIAVAAGCAFTGAKDNITQESKVYERFGLKLAVPKDAEGTIDYTPAKELDDSTFIKVWHIPSRDAGCGGKLCTIVRHPIQDFEEYRTQMEASSGTRHFAMDDKYVYSIEFPTDMQIIPEYAEEIENGTDASASYFYNNTPAAYSALIADFIERNGLTPYQATELPGDTGTSYRLGGYPIECNTSDGGTETVYLTSITLRKDSAMCNFILSSNDAPTPNTFPDIIALTEDGKEYTLTATLVVKGAVVFQCTDVPVAQIVSLKIGGETLQIYALPLNPEAEDVYLERLNDLPTMGYAELFAYCVGSDGAYAEGVYSEMAKRFIRNPDAFAAHLMLPAYPFTDYYQKSISTINMEFASTLGFNRSTNYEICYNVLYECTPEERDAAIMTLLLSSNSIISDAGSLFSLANNNLDKSSGVNN